VRGGVEEVGSSKEARGWRNEGNKGRVFRRRFWAEYQARFLFVCILWGSSRRFGDALTQHVCSFHPLVRIHRYLYNHDVVDCQ